MKKYYFLILLCFLALIWSGTSPYRYLLWVGEAAYPIIGSILLITTFKKFRFTFLTYIAILVSFYLMLIGAHYSFARVPLFDTLRDYLGQSRNNFDKVGHFVQGVIPVLVTREIFVRKKIVSNQKWLSFMSLCICMAVTSSYEIIEYLVCWMAGVNLNSFMGAQGDIWDSQKDMLSAVIGGLITIVLLQKTHDRIIEKEFPGTFPKFARINSEPDSSIRKIKKLAGNNI
jgi:putative membrane protein